MRNNCQQTNLSSTSELLLFPLGSLFDGFLSLLIELGVILVLVTSTIPGENYKVRVKVRVRVRVRVLVLPVG